MNLQISRFREAINNIGDNIVGIWVPKVEDSYIPLGNHMVTFYVLLDKESKEGFDFIFGDFAELIDNLTGNKYSDNLLYVYLNKSSKEEIVEIMKSSTLIYAKGEVNL